MPSPPTPPRRRNGPQRAGAPERSVPHLRAEGDVASPRPPCALPARPARPDIPLGSETPQGPAPAAGRVVPCPAARAGQCCSDPRRGQAGLVTAAPPGDWALPAAPPRGAWGPDGRFPYPLPPHRRGTQLPGGCHHPHASGAGCQICFPTSVPCGDRCCVCP